MALVRVYCGLVSAQPSGRQAVAGPTLTAAIVDDAGRLLDVCEIGDDPAGYARLGALLVERSSGPSGAAIAADSDDHLVTALLAAAGRPLAIADDEAADDYAERFADDESLDEMESPAAERRAVGLARALQAGALFAVTVPTPRDLASYKPVLAAHAALASGRHASAATLREVLRELYPAALRAYPDPAEPLALAILDAMPEPSMLTGTGARGRDQSPAVEALASRLSVEGVADGTSVSEAITALRVAIAETPRRTGVSRSLASASADAVRQAVAAVRSYDAGSAALVATLADRMAVVQPTAPRRLPRRAAAAQGSASVPGLHAVPAPVSALPAEHARPAAEQERATAEHEHPPTEHERHAAEHEHPPTEHERHAAEHEHPPAEYERPTAEHERPTAEHERPTAEHERPPTEHERPTAEHERPPTRHARPPVESPPVERPGGGRRHRPEPAAASVAPSVPQPLTPPPVAPAPIAPPPIAPAAAAAHPGVRTPAAAPESRPAASYEPVSPSTVAPIVPGRRPGSHEAPSAHTPAASFEPPDSSRVSATLAAHLRERAEQTPDAPRPQHAAPPNPEPWRAEPPATRPVSVPPPPPGMTPIPAQRTISPQADAAEPVRPTVTAAPVSPARPERRRPTTIPQRPSTKDVTTEPAAAGVSATDPSPPLPTRRAGPGARANWPLVGGADDRVTVEARPEDSYAFDLPPSELDRPVFSSAADRVTPPWLADDLPAEPPMLRLVEPPPVADRALRDDLDERPRYEVPPPLRLVESDPIHRNGSRHPVAGEPPVPDEGDGDLLIFAAARSAWFVGHAGEEEEVWSSVADTGWRAAEAASEPAVGAQTHAGLPRRVPQANLVPGSPLRDERPLRIVRDAASIAAHTTGYFSGWRRGQEIGGYALGGRPGRESAGGWEFSRDDAGRDESLDYEYRSARS